MAAFGNRDRTGAHIECETYCGTGCDAPDEYIVACIGLARGLRDLGLEMSHAYQKVVKIIDAFYDSRVKQKRFANEFRNFLESIVSPLATYFPSKWMDEPRWRLDITRIFRRLQSYEVRDRSRQIRLYL